MDEILNVTAAPVPEKEQNWESTQAQYVAMKIAEKVGLKPMGLPEVDRNNGSTVTLKYAEGDAVISVVIDDEKSPVASGIFITANGFSAQSLPLQKIDEAAQRVLYVIAELKSRQSESKTEISNETDVELAIRTSNMPVTDKMGEIVDLIENEYGVPVNVISNEESEAIFKTGAIIKLYAKRGIVNITLPNYLTEEHNVQDVVFLKNRLRTYLDGLAHIKKNPYKDFTIGSIVTWANPLDEDEREEQFEVTQSLIFPPDYLARLDLVHRNIGKDPQPKMVAKHLAKLFKLVSNELVPEPQITTAEMVAELLILKILHPLKMQGKKHTSPRPDNTVFLFYEPDIEVIIEDDKSHLVSSVPSEFKPGIAVVKNKVFAEQYGLNEIDKAAQAVNLLITGKTFEVDPPSTKKTSAVLQITNDEGGAYMGVDFQYPNQYALNKAIEGLLMSRGDDYQNYTAEEKMFLSKYSGYGGLSEFGEAGKGAFFEYYTPKPIIEKMWALAYKYGYNNGPVLEPSCATGEFFQFAKADTQKVGYEISEWSAKICKILYPTATIHIQPFEKAFIKNNFTVRDKTDELEKFDLVIGNPPYGDFSIVQSRYMAMGEKDHVRPLNYVEYFLRRGLDLLNPGGLLIYIVGAAIQGGGILFLDSGPSSVKDYLAQNSELLEAYRLPDTVFERTGVTSDIIVLRKK